MAAKINSIYKQYLVLSLSILSLIIFIILAIIFIDYKLLINDRELKYSQEAKSISDYIETNFDFIEEFSRIIAKKIVDSNSLSPKIIADILTKDLPKSFMNEDTFYFSVFDFVTPEGKVVASTLEGVIQSDLTVPKERRSWMQLAPLEPWKIHLSPADEGIVSNKQPSYIIPAGLGITDHNGKFIGIISTGLEINRLYSKVKRNNLSLHASFLLLSDKMELISPYDEDKKIFKNKINNSIIKGKFGILDKDIEYKNVRYSYYRKLKNWPFIILVGENSKALNNEFNNKVIPHIIQITLISFLIFLFFYLIRTRVIFPIIDLSKAAQKIANGNTNVPIPTYNNHEMNLLSNELLKIRNYTAELKSTKDKLEDAQSMLQSINHKLEAKVLERTSLLEKALAVKTEFLNNISHEVRTPIQGITAISEGLSEQWHSLSEEKRYIYAKEVAKNAKRLFSLVENILDISRFSNNKIVLNLQEIHFNSLIKEIITECKTLYCRNKKINFSFKPENQFYVILDSIKITQVLRNLIFNAIKFSSTDKTIFINLNKDKLTFDNSNNPQKKYKVDAVHCTIIDQGIGIPEKELEAIFEPFHQASNAKTGAGGTGLGLSIAKEIILAHNGKIWAKSDENGSEFHFIIPITQTID